MHDINEGYEKILNDFKNNRSARVKRQVRNVLKLIDIAEGEEILEVGTATGKFTAMFSKANHVSALDICEDNLKRAKKVVAEMGNPANLVCVPGNCAKMPFNNDVFDRVMAIDIIEHLTDETFNMFCKESHRVLKAGGYLYIYTPNLLHPFELTRPFRPVMRREHIGVRTRAKICETLKRNNFSIEKSYFNNLFRRISIKAKKDK